MTSRHRLLGAFAVDGDGLVVSVFAPQVLGIPLADVVRAPILRVVHPDDRAGVVALMAEAEERGRSRSRVVRLRGGGRFWPCYELTALAPAGDAGVLLTVRRAPADGPGPAAAPAITDLDAELRRAS